MSPFGKRILILVPHPDDEVVGCGGAIQRAQQQGAEVTVLLLSHGCLARETLWPWERGHHENMVARRLQEAESVARFMGFTLIQHDAPRAARQIWPQLAYVESEVRTALQRYAPDCLWVPAYEGGNPDHDALNALASTIKEVPVFEMAEYHFAGGKEHTGSFIHPRDDETCLTLSAAEAARKQQALALYASEKGNLSYFRGPRGRQESLRPLRGYDYSQPPHEGPLWYQRHQWVPFPHPRVDFTRPAAVSDAIMHFLEKKKA